MPDEGNRTTSPHAVASILRGSLPAITAVLFLALLITVCADAAGQFTLIRPWVHMAIVAVAIGGFVLVLRSGTASRSAWFTALVAVPLAVLLLSLNAISHAVRLAALPSRIDSLLEADLQQRADRIQTEFRSLTASMQAPLEHARRELAARPDGDAEIRSEEAFRTLDRAVRISGFEGRGRGISLYGPGGEAIAWFGNSFPLPEGLLDDLGTRITHRIAVEPAVTRLYAILSDTRHVPGFLVAETTLESLFDPGPIAASLPSVRSGAVLRMQDFRSPTDRLDAVFRDRGDRYDGSSDGERRTLFAALRTPPPDSGYLGHVRIGRGMKSAVVEDLAAAHRRASAALVAILTIVLTGAAGARLRPGRTPERPLASLAAGLAACWGGRLVLSWFPLRLPVGGFDLFDASWFASVRFGNLLRSPGDLLLTACVLLASGLLLLRTCGQLRPDAGAAPRPVMRAAGWVLIVGIAVSAVTHVPALARDLVQNANVAILDFEVLAFDPPAHALRIATILALLALVLALQAAFLLLAPSRGWIAWLARRVPRPGDGLSRWALHAIAPGCVIAACVLDPLLQPHQQRVTESIIEDVLMTEVVGRHEQRTARLRETIGALAAMPDLADRILSAEPGDPTLAIDLWRGTPIDRSGDDASLLIENAAGRLVSRFGRNFPPSLDRAARTSDPDHFCEPGVEDLPFHDVLKTILHGCHEVIAGGRRVGTVTIHILDDPQILLRPATPYARALAPRERRLLGVPAHASVEQSSYARDRLEHDPSLSRAPTPPHGWDGTPLWRDGTIDGAAVRALFFTDDLRNAFALTFPLPGPMSRVARAIRFLILSGLVIGVLLIPAALGTTRGRLGDTWSRLLAGLGRTHYRKILATFTAATLIPLVALSILMTEYIRTEIERDVEDRGRQSILTALKLARSIQIQDFDLNDDIAHWLSELIGEDVNLYRGPMVLATSRRELFDTGLLPSRLDGEVYSRLVIGGEPFAFATQDLRGISHLTITATVPGPLGSGPTLLSLPLAAQSEEVAKRAREISDAMLITFAGMIVLMGALGYLFARRVSRPVRNLSAAAARIAAGDFDAVVSDRPRDEIGGLIQSFNTMAVAIRRQREDLERRRDYIEKILRHATIGVISMDRDTRVVTCNPAARTILGFANFGPGADLGAVLRGTAFAPLNDALRAGGRDVAQELSIALPGGAPDRTIRARIVPFLEGEGLILLLEDVTEAVRSNRLEAWAEMARRIAHEIKNPLTPIQLSAEHIRRIHAERHGDFDAVLEECLGTIMQEVAKLRLISREFSTYARIPTPRREPTPMSAFILEAVKPYRRLPPGLSLELDVQPDLPTAAVDRSLLSRAFVNLIENALQAMPDGGVLTVRARSGNGLLRLEVVDTGVGMDARAITRIFEPYFSTKDLGTGLGLAIARRAIEEHGGRIEVSSGPGEGTVMRVLLPLGEEGGAESPDGTGRGSAP